ncbi:MAG: gliding motility-associated C-terminal domain-containing protein, partial [Crocinitomicaceae bacterium]
ANGCDSTVTLNFTLLPPATSTDNISSCSPLTWIDGNTYNASNNTATFTISGGAANGCDSTVTLNFTLLPPATSTDNISSCSPLTWIDGNTYSSSNNTSTYTYVGGAANGCDSTVTLNFTFLPSSTGTDVISSCTPLTWIDGNTYNASNNTATFTISGGAANGCDSTVSLNFVLLPTPVLTLSANQTVCGGNPTAISNFGNSVSGGSFTYDINNFASIPPEIVNYPSNGTGQIPSAIIDNNSASNYTLTYTITPTANGCSGAPATYSITIKPTVSISLSDTAICAGQTVQLLSVVNLPGGVYLWTNGNPTASISVTPSANTTYSVLYTLNGCLAQASSNVTVNPIPAVVVTSETICAGESTTLTATPTILGGSFLWSNATDASTITISPLTTTTYTVVYTLNGCSSSAASGTVTVNPTPQLNIQSLTICEGEVATLIATPDILGGTFVWTPNGETTNSIDVNPSTTSNYSAVYTLNNCQSNIANATVTVNPIPLVSFDANNLTGCTPLSAQLWNTSTVNSSSTFVWTVDGNIVSTEDTINQVFLAGCHDISLEVNQDGCIGIADYADFICVENYPQAIFITNPTSFTEINQTLSLINNSVGATSYVWNTGDNNIFTSEDIEHLFTNTTEGYTIWLTAISNFGCTDSTSLTIEYQTGVSFYVPNSFTPDDDNYNEMFIPRFPSSLEIKEYTMYIFNRWGQIVFISLNPYIGWDGSIGDNGVDCPDGVYTYKILYKIEGDKDERMAIGHVNLIR